jgi:hypothetical protein
MAKPATMTTIATTMDDGHLHNSLAHTPSGHGVQYPPTVRRSRPRPTAHHGRSPNQAPKGSRHLRQRADAHRFNTPTPGGSPLLNESVRGSFVYSGPSSISKIDLTRPAQTHPGLGIPKFQMACIIVHDRQLAKGVLEGWGLGVLFLDVLAVMFGL